MIYPRGDIRMLSCLPRQNSANKKPVHVHYKAKELEIYEGGVCVPLLYLTVFLVNSVGFALLVIAAYMVRC